MSINFHLVVSFFFATTARWLAIAQIKRSVHVFPSFTSLLLQPFVSKGLTTTVGDRATEKPDIQRLASVIVAHPVLMLQGFWVTYN